MNAPLCQNRFAPDAACRMLRPALQYASRGWPVFPCKPESKKPYTLHGFKDASVDREKIVCWWVRHPGAMIGLPTGPASRLVVVDLDREGTEKDGVTDFYLLAKSAGANIRTRIHQTPRGGLHLFYWHPGVFVKSTTSAIAPDVDTRGDGGYVILPPSRNETGEYSVKVDTDPAPLPPWLESLFREHKVMAMEHGDTDRHGDRATTDIESHALLQDSSVTSGRESALYQYCHVAPLPMSVEAVIEKTQPKAKGQRNKCLMELARGLKFNAGLAKASEKRLLAIVERWHSKALPVVGTKDFGITWQEFLHAWKNARHPLGCDVVGLAMKLARSNPPDTPKLKSKLHRILYGLCFHLAALNNDGGRFFLSSYVAERYLEGVAKNNFDIWRVLAKSFVRRGFLAIVSDGDRHKANRYRWLGGDMTTKK